MLMCSNIYTDITVGTYYRNADITAIFPILSNKDTDVSTSLYRRTNRFLSKQIEKPFLTFQISTIFLLHNVNLIYHIVFLLIWNYYFSNDYELTLEKILRKYRPLHFLAVWILSVFWVLIICLKGALSY